MVVLTIVTEKNGETIFFEMRIPQVHFIKLISCSLYNSWYNLKKEGSANIELREGVKSVGKIPPGHYDLQSLGEKIDNLFGRYNYKQLETEINQPNGQLVIRNFGAKPIELDKDLANLLGISRKLALTTFVKQITSPTTYFIHCDLIDKEHNLFNGKRTDLLACFDIKGKTYEKVTYNSSPQQVLRECATYDFKKFINSITLSVKDENGDLFDFKGLPLAFELELN